MKYRVLCTIAGSSQMAIKGKYMKQGTDMRKIFYLDWFIHRKTSNMFFKD